MEYFENTSTIVVIIKEEINIMNDMNYVIKNFKCFEY